MNETMYWKSQVTQFIDNTLIKERVEYLPLASCIDEEIEKVRQLEEKKFKENPEEFVIFLYVEHDLNKSDPLGCAYPSVVDEYSRYAWYIVELYKNMDRDKFYKQLPKYLEGIWDGVCNYDRNRNQQIRRTADNIVKVIDELYKKKKEVEGINI